MRNLLVVAVLVLAVAGTASAQERDDAGFIVSAHVCAASRELTAWKALGRGSDDLQYAVASGVIDSASLCRTEASVQAPDTEVQERINWLLRADILAVGLNKAVADALGQPLSVQARGDLKVFARTAAQLQTALNEYRRDAYSRVEAVEVPKEVIRTVQVAAQCPEPVRNPCTDSLRAGAGRWADQLWKWTDTYQGSGDDWQFAKNSIPSLRGIQSGYTPPSKEDPVPVLVGWLAQYRSVRRRGSQSFLGSGPLPQIAADMRAQLALCGYAQADPER